MRSNILAVTVVIVLVASAVIVGTARLFEEQRAPGSKFVFENGFKGVYCVAIWPEYPAAPLDPAGFTVYTFDGRGIARSSTFPAGKGAVNRAVSVDRRLNRTQPIADRSPCGTLSFGERTVLFGVVGSAHCPKYDTARPLSFDAALALYCK